VRKEQTSGPKLPKAARSRLRLVEARDGPSEVVLARFALLGGPRFRRAVRRGWCGLLKKLLRGSQPILRVRWFPPRMTEAGYAVESPRVSFRSGPRAGRRLAASTALSAFVAGNAALLIWLWVHGGNVSEDLTTGELSWSVGIQHPLRRDAVAAVVMASDLAVATSGAYARGDHLRNPHTGRALTRVLSVTVVGSELATADAYATAAFAMGPVGGPHWTARLNRYEAMTILADETIFLTGGFPDG
jgi:hypothetical protein